MEEMNPVMPQPTDQTPVLPPEPAYGEMSPVPMAPPPPPQGLDLGTPEEIEALLMAALDKEFLKGHPNGMEIQQLATSINMLMKDPRIPPEEKQRLLEELIPKLLELMEAGIQ